MRYRNATYALFLILAVLVAAGGIYLWATSRPPHEVTGPHPHEKRLRDRGVVAYRKEGRLAYYRLSDDRLRGLLESGVGDSPVVTAS